MTSFFTALGRFSVRFRWPIVFLWLVGLVAAVSLLPPLSSAVQNNNSSFLPANAPSEQAATLAEPFIGATDSSDVLVVLASTNGSPLGAADFAAAQRAMTLIDRIPHVTSTRLIGISPDRQAAQIDARVVIDFTTNTEAQDLIDSIRTALKQSDPPTTLAMHTAGALATAVDVNNQSGGNGNKSQNLSLLFIIVLLLLVYRSILAPIITLLPALFVLLIAGPIIAELAKHGLHVSGVAQILLIVLVLGAGTDYGLFLVFRVREEIRRGRSHRDAVVFSLTRVGESITFSAGTVIAALLSLLLASFGVYHELAIPLAIGIGLILFAGLTLLPALLAIFGRGLFWPSRPKAGGEVSGLWGRLAGRVIQRPAIPLAVGLVLLGGLAFASLGNKPGGFGGAVTAPAGSDSAMGNQLLGDHFPQSSANPTSIVLEFRTTVWQDPAPLAAAQQALERSGRFLELTGPLDPLGRQLEPAQLSELHAVLGSPRALPVTPPTTGPASKIPVAAYEAYRATSQFIAPNGQVVQFEASLPQGDPSSTPAIQAVPGLRDAAQQAAQASGAEQYGLAGEAPALYDVNTISSSDLKRIVPVAVIVIGVLLALLLRSLIAPIYLIASVVVSFFAALGVSVIIFLDFGNNDGLTFILPFLMFVFLLALGEDYNILVMSRIREEAHDLTLKEAVVRALSVTGTTVTSAGLVLAGTFIVVALAGSSGSGGSEIEQIGFGLAIGILMDTFFVRTILVPALVVVLGRWNWWPARLSRGHAFVASLLDAAPTDRTGDGDGAEADRPAVPAATEGDEARE